MLFEFERKFNSLLSPFMSHKQKPMESLKTPERDV